MSFRHTFQPGLQGGTHNGGQLDLLRAVGLLLNDGCPIANLGTRNHLADLDFHQIATARLVIDGEIEKGLYPSIALRDRDERGSPKSAYRQ